MYGVGMACAWRLRGRRRSASILERSATSAAGCVLFRNEQDGMADAQAFELLGAIVPHLRRAVLIGNVIEHKNTEAQGFSDLLDRVKAGVL